MGILSNILDKLGIGKKDAVPATNTGSSSASTTDTAAGTGMRPNPSYEVPPTRPAEHVQPKVVIPPKEQSIAVVDVVSQLEKRAAANSQKLNWRASIVDLLKLLEIDSGLEARKELARELHCPPELLEDSAKMNMWLHKTVLSRIAANGGNIPKDVTD